MIRISGAVAVMAVVIASPGIARQSAPFTVRDAIETTRVMVGNPTYTSGMTGQMKLRTDAVFVSPDGRHYALMLIRGHVDSNLVEVRLAIGSLAGTKEEATPRVVATLYTPALGTTDGLPGSSDLLQPGLNAPIWLSDSRRVAFMWTDARGVRQVVTVDLDGHIHYETHSDTAVVDFRFGPGKCLYYSALRAVDARQNAQLLQDGFVVRSVDLVGLLLAHVDGQTADSLYDTTEAYVSCATRHREATYDIGTSKIRTGWMFRPQFSPNEDFVIAPLTPRRIPQEWRQYEDSYTKSRVMASLETGSDSDDKSASMQLYLVRVNSGSAEPLINAPLASGLDSSVQIRWSADGKNALVWPTYLPVSSVDPAGRVGRAAAVIHLPDRSVTQVPLSPGEVTDNRIEDVQWVTSQHIRVRRAGNGTIDLRFADKRWNRSEAPGTDARRHSESPIAVELRQDANSPPKLYAIDRRDGSEQLLMDLNPQLSKFKLAHVEAYSWSDPQGRIWHGLLYVPADLESGGRPALVIQTHGAAIDGAFSVYGPGGWQPGLGPSVGPYAAQPLAAKGIVVLQMQDKRVEGVSGSPREPQMYMAAMRAATNQLAAADRIDGRRVGLEGYSRMGWKVEYTLSHSSYPYGAAFVADNYDGGYLYSLLRPWPDVIADAGAAPFGNGLKVWLVNSPAFNVERVHTPLELVAGSMGLPGLLLPWEMYSRLKYLEKPVELYVIPDIMHSVHGVQNPLQCLRLQERAVDWFEFWLNGHEDPDPSKRGQYDGWEKLCDLQRAKSPERQSFCVGSRPAHM